MSPKLLDDVGSSFFTWIMTITLCMVLGLFFYACCCLAVFGNFCMDYSMIFCPVVSARSFFDS